VPPLGRGQGRYINWSATGAARASLTCTLSQRPPVLPLQARYQPRHLLPDPGPRL